MKDVFKKIILPIAGVLFLLWFGEQFYVVEGQIEWFRLGLVVGIPFWIPLHDLDNSRYKTLALFVPWLCDYLGKTIKRYA